MNLDDILTAAAQPSVGSTNLAHHLFPNSPPRQPHSTLKLSTAKWLEKNLAGSNLPESTSSSSSHSSPMANPRRSSSRSLLPLPSESSSRATRRSSKGSPMLPQGPDEGGYASPDSQPPLRAGTSVGNASEDVVPEFASNGAYVNGSGVAEGEEYTSVGGRTLRARRVVKDSDDEGEQDGEGEMDEDAEMHDAPPPSKRGRGRPRKTLQHSDSDDGYVDHQPRLVPTTTLHGRRTLRPALYTAGTSEEDEEDFKPRKSAGLRRGGSSRRKSDFVEPDDDYDREDDGYGERKRSSRQEEKKARQDQERKEQDRALRSSRQDALTKKSEPKPRATRNSQKADVDVSFDMDHEEHSEISSDTDEGLDLHDDDDDGVGPMPRRKLRQKAKIDYYTIPPLEALPDKKSKNKGKGRATDGDPFSGLPHNMTGAQWAALYPEKGAQVDSDSDDDVPNFSTPRKAALFSSNAAAAAAGFGGGGGMLAGGANLDMTAAGTPNNLGKVGNAASLADTDPLGVSSTVSFDSVGGLGSHIQQLKEMVSLPLLYPEVFERFNITPPRGVLFHGPPGTGKTLLARALAASCSTEGRKISFFMRKGADCLSKWVGEAERQLRLLFEEAKACQPSIIFFDEIDGLAPVRSSKQEQIHASIVSTLLALMDGMDGRGQVIVIGATNRPDAIDPALRRPGRFDREFYFPLPNLEGRRKILDIHTTGWNPPIEESFKDELAALTKGYGGADLRALCTEAALNAVQRTYPQIYKTNERLVIKPETIDVTARDFIVSQKNLIPSTARATSSPAAPIPPQLVPLLADAFEAAKKALAMVLPDVKRPNVLEEAEWEDDSGGFEKEKMMQAFETLRVFRPRMLICGEPGLGQGYVGAAALHHLEGFHVQTLDLATLVGDSSRTMEAACVQLFVEAKRHKPSILFIPSLLTWCSTVTDTVKSTIKGLLDGLDPSDPILLLAVVDGNLADLPGDVRGWFGFVKGNRVVMTHPGPDQRKTFFEEVIQGIQRPPNEFPDAMPRRKRVLEQLAIAPPPPPKVPTAAEIAQLEQNDQRLLEYLKWRLGPVLNELKKRYKRFQRSLYDDWKSDDLEWRVQQQKSGEEILGLGTQPYHNVDLDSMHMDLYKGFYHTPDDFLADILRIQANAEINALLENDAEAPVKAGQMLNHSKVMIDQTFDVQFKTDCARMAERMAEREKNRPEGEKKGKGKGKGKAVVSEREAIAAAAAAGGGGRYGTRSRGIAARVETDGPVELPDIGALERGLKRSRREGEDSHAEDEGPAPAKKAKGVDGIEDDDDARGEDDEDAQPVASTSQLNGIHAAGPSTNGFEDSFNHVPLPALTLTNSLLPDSFPLGHQLAPPMPVGGNPDLDDMEFAGPLDDLPPLPDLNSLPLSSLQGGLFPSTSSLAIPHLPEAGPSTNVHFAENATLVEPEAEVAVATAVERESTPANPTSDGGAPIPDPAPREPSPIIVDPPTPEPLPDFVLSPLGLESLVRELGEETDGLNVDQLEQLRAACYDIIWRGRKEWERDGMVDEIRELAREFVEEVRECC